MRRARIVMGTIGLAAALVGVAGVAFAQQMLKNEPPQGGMRTGEVVFVDNGKCKGGQVMKVTAGYFNGRQGSGNGGGARQRECVPRP